MAGEEDDYMGDLSQFLPLETSDSSRSKKRRTEEHSQEPTQRNLGWQQKRKLNREQQQREEDEKTLSLAQTALEPSNIGFRMLQQMGYKPGSALGKEGQGRVEPVGLQIRRSRTGIGAQTPAEARASRERARKDRLKRTEEGLASEFGSRQKSAWRVRKVAADYKKAEAALAQLENADVVAPPSPEDGSEEAEEEEVITEEGERQLVAMEAWYFTNPSSPDSNLCVGRCSWQTRFSPCRGSACPFCSDGDSQTNDGFKAVEDLDHRLLCTQDLQELLSKLRDKHFYCLYCGCQYESMEALLSNCPGDEDDH